MTRAVADSGLGTLCLQEERLTAQCDAKPRQQRHPAIRPEVKAWIDNVIVPALVEEWQKQSAPRLAA